MRVQRLENTAISKIVLNIFSTLDLRRHCKAPSKEQGGWGRTNNKAAPGSDGPAWPAQSVWGNDNQWEDSWNRPHPPASPRPVPFDGSAPQSAQDYHASRGIGPDDCAYCRQPGHYKRDCPLAKAASAKGKGGGKGGSFRRW